MEDNWQALESNPEVMNEYVEKLGFDTKQFNFQDLYSTEDWAKEMIKKPVLGMLLIFPYNKKYLDFRKEEHKKILEKGQDINKDLFYMKQLGMNSCGTVGLYHILSNMGSKYNNLIKEDSIIWKLKKDSKNLNSMDIGKLFVKNESIKNIHKDQVKKGQSKVEDKVQKHFVAFVQFNGCIYELDGGKEFPINHGKSSEQTFLDDASILAKQFMQRDPESVEFGIVVLAKANANQQYQSIINLNFLLNQKSKKLQKFIQFEYIIFKQCKIIR